MYSSKLWQTRNAIKMDPWGKTPYQANLNSNGQQDIQRQENNGLHLQYCFIKIINFYLFRYKKILQSGKWWLLEMLLRTQAFQEISSPPFTLPKLLCPLQTPCLNQKITEMQIEQSNLSVPENISELTELHWWDLNKPRESWYLIYSSIM